MREPIELLIEELTSIDKKVILALYHYEKLRFNELLKITGIGGKGNFSERLKILKEKIGIIDKENKHYTLTKDGKEIARKIIFEKEPYLIKYFKKKLKPIFSQDYLSFPLKFELKCLFNIYNPYKILEHYIPLIYIKSCRKKISKDSRKLIKYINKTWRIIEKQKDIQFETVKFDYNEAIEEILKDIDKEIIRAEGIDKEALILIKEKIENNKEKLFKDLYEYSKNPILWKLKKIKVFSRIYNIFLGIIAGIISSLILFLINNFLLLIGINFIQFVTLNIYVLIGIALGIMYSYLYKIIPVKDSRIKGIIFSIFLITIPIILLYSYSQLENLRIAIAYFLLIAFIYGYTLGYSFDKIKKLFLYFGKRIFIKKEEKEILLEIKEEIIENKILPINKIRKIKIKDLKALRNIENISKKEEEKLKELGLIKYRGEKIILTNSGKEVLKIIKEYLIEE